MGFRREGHSGLAVGIGDGRCRGEEDSCAGLHPPAHWYTGHCSQWVGEPDHQLARQHEPRGPLLEVPADLDEALSGRIGRGRRLGGTPATAMPHRIAATELRGTAKPRYFTVTSVE